jgi:hypothetical protein
MSDEGETPEFTKYRDSLPAAHWSKYDLSAVKQGWEAGIAMITASGWRCCIDHILEPAHSCPICEIEKLKHQLAEVCKNIGISGQLAKQSTPEQLGVLARLVYEKADKYESTRR